MKNQNTLVILLLLLCIPINITAEEVFSEEKVVLSNDMDAWALTDHGNGNGLAHAHTHAKKLKARGQKYRQTCRESTA